MIALEDCIGLCGLTEAEVAAIAEHEHLPEIAAANMARYLLGRDHGPEQIRDILVDDIRQSIRCGNPRHAAELMGALRHFLGEHPALVA